MTHYPEKLWDVASGQEKALLEGHTDYVRSVSFSPDGTTLVRGSDDSTTRVRSQSAMNWKKWLLIGGVVLLLVLASAAILFWALNQLLSAGTA